MTTYLLTPPTVRQTPMAWNRLHARYALIRGIAIVQRQDGSFYETQVPAQTELEDSLRYWLGGYQHLVSQEIADMLTAAGYGEYLTPLGGDAGYGLGGYGEGPYGE